MSQPKFDRKELEFIKESLDFINYRETPEKQRSDNIIKKINRALTPIKVSSAKSKGRELQKRICQDISDVIGISYDQKDDFCLIHSREMGQSGCDIVLRGEAKRLFPYSIECKNTESLSLYAAIDQAKSNIYDQTEWMVIHKRKGSDPIVIMDWAGFLKKYAEKGYLK